MATFNQSLLFNQYFEQKVSQKALAKTVSAFGDAIQDAIEASVYFWDRETERSNGTRVSTPRNIKDTGEFKRSQVANQVSFRRWEIAWLVSYAIYIFLGGVNRSDGTVTPGRNPVEEALNNIDLAKIFAEEMGRIL